MKRTPLLSILGAGLLAACGSDGDRGARGDRPNVLLVTWDTTRADHLSCYGYEKETSPKLDRLAADGMLYERCYAVTSWTLPAHASLFTGKFPSAHGAQYDPDGPLKLTQGIQGNPAWSAYSARPLSDKEITLAQVLKENGYATGAVIAGPWMKRVFGLDVGFDEYDDQNFVMLQGSELNGRPAEDVTRAAIDFVDRHEDEPFFLFLNYYDPHGPLTPRPAFLKRFWKGPPPQQMTAEFQLAQYDAEIAYTDHHFGRLIDSLKERGLYEDTWILVTADHGELFGENGMVGHGNSLTQPEIHIPLIVKEPGPNRPRGTDDALVQQVDVMPHLLGKLGLPLPPNMQGVPLGDRGHPIFAEVYPLTFMGQNRNARQQGDWRAMFKGDKKYLWSSHGNHELYDLTADPTEGRNVIAEHPEIASQLAVAIEKYLDALPAPGELGDVETMDHETLELLKGFGYIGEDQ